MCGHEPHQASYHANAMLRFARSALQACEGQRMPGGEPLRIRIGMHCGAVRAGIIGFDRPQYTFMGDTARAARQRVRAGTRTGR